MKATIPYVEKKFGEFNRLIFDGKLPMLPIELTNAKTYIGACVYKRRRGLFGQIKLYDFKLRISTRFDLAENVIEDTIIHEMIHYYISINNIKDTSTHGKVFRQIMNSVNERFGRNITISHKATDEEKEQLCGTKRRWHVVAVVSLDNGRTGVKVLPRVMPKIIDFCRQLSMVKPVKSYKLYLTDEPFFNRYPTSTALRIIYVEKELLDKHLASAEQLVIENDRVVSK